MDVLEFGEGCSSFCEELPCGPVVKILPSVQGVQVRSLTGELRSHLLRSAAKKKKKFYLKE